MKTQIILSFALVSVLTFSAVLRAQTPQKSAAQGADFTGVWYPSSGATLGAATPDNPGQQFVWLDPQGKPLKGPLPMTPWGAREIQGQSAHWPQRHRN